MQHPGQHCVSQRFGDRWCALDQRDCAGNWGVWLRVDWFLGRHLFFVTCHGLVASLPNAAGPGASQSPAAQSPAASARDASSAADIRLAFFESCAGSVPRKEVGLRLARKGFAEESAHFFRDVVRTTRRVFRYNFPDGGAYVALLARPGSTGGS